MTEPGATGAPFVLVAGCGRSGTTLVQAILHAHPDLAVAHEAKFLLALGRRARRYGRGPSFDRAAFLRDLLAMRNTKSLGLGPEAITAAVEAAAPTDFAAAARAVYAAFAAGHGKPRAGDKTPGYITDLPLVTRLLPEAKVLHVIRDGRDSTLSYLDHAYGPADLEQAAFRWRNRVRKGKRAGAALGDRYAELRYEDLVADPERELRRVSAFFELPWSDRLLHHEDDADAVVAATKTQHRFQNVRRPITPGLRDWRQKMAADDVRRFEAIAGDALRECGYETTGEPRRVPVGPWVRWQKRRAVVVAADRKPW